jgi:glyoxylate utilization-related uncharacterized protein
VIRFAEARARIPGPTGEYAVGGVRRGTLDVALSMPETPKQQTPHAQDEVYVIVRGRGALLHNGKREPLAEGDLVFIAAGTEHQFEGLQDHFAVWRVFYGPLGGDIPRGVSSAAADATL